MASPHSDDAAVVSDRGFDLAPVASRSAAFAMASSYAVYHGNDSEQRGSRIVSHCRTSIDHQGAMDVAGLEPHHDESMPTRALFARCPLPSRAIPWQVSSPLSRQIGALAPDSKRRTRAMPRWQNHKRRPRCAPRCGATWGKG